MGLLDRFEDWKPYKAVWTRIGGRPWTHIARDCLGRWPGVLVYGCVCFGLGAWAGGAPLALSIGIAFVFTLIHGHLFV